MGKNNSAMTRDAHEPLNRIVWGFEAVVQQIMNAALELSEESDWSSSMVSEGKEVRLAALMAGKRRALIGCRGLAQTGTARRRQNEHLTSSNPQVEFTPAKLTPLTRRRA